MVLEMVRLIQAALAIWGMIPDDMGIDGLFCDETKKGLFAWRRAMGMEHEDSMKLEVSAVVTGEETYILTSRKRRVEDVSIQKLWRLC